MIPLPHYQIIEFLDWVSQKYPIDMQKISDKKIRELAEIYMSSKDYSTTLQSDSVIINVHFLKLLQACPLQLGKPLEAIDHLSKCSVCQKKCIEYINKHGIKHLKNVILHPLLKGFETFAQGENLELDIIFNKRHFSNLSPDAQIEPFSIYFRKNKDALLSAYSRYIEKENISDDITRDYVREYFDMQSHTDGSNAKNRVSPIEIRESKQSSIQQEADRLVESLRILKDGGYYEEYLENDIEGLYHLSNLSILTYQSQESIEFLIWLQSNYPKIDISSNMPINQVEELVFEFCKEHNYENSSSFAEIVTNWLTGKGSRNFVERLIEIGRNIKRKNQTYNFRVTPAKRYETISFHAMFLFLSAGDFPTFVKTYWEDLNYLSGDYLDIYYSNEDLERRVSGFESLNNFRSLSLEPMSMPAIVLWQTSLKDACAIPLEQLSHQEIFELVKLVVQSIKHEQKLSEICVNANNFVASKRATPIPEFTLNFEGDFVMKKEEKTFTGDNIEIKNVTNAQIAIKSHAIFSGITQAIGDSSKFSQTTKDELEKLIERLNQELGQVPEEHAKDANDVAEKTEHLVKAAKEAEPDKEYVEISAKRLLKAAQNIAKVVPLAVGIAQQIIKLLVG